MQIFVLLMTIFFILGIKSLGAPEENCKLTIRTRFKSGKVKVDVEEIHKDSKADCKKEATEREKNTDPEEISSITASYKFYE